MQNEQGVPIDQWAVIGYLKLDRFLKSVSIVHLSEIVIANHEGAVLVHPDARQLANKPSLAGTPLFQQALDSKTRLSVTNFEGNGEKYLAAMAKAFRGHLFVIAKTPENQVFQVVRDLSVRTLLFGLIVLTLVVLAAFILARSITQNLDLLTERMEAASAGDLSSTIHVRGRDETVQLAQTFNQMIVDLRTSRDELEKMNRELDLKVQERTHQLEVQNAKVKEAQEALLRTTRLASVGEIAGRTAHEVLNPLTSLLTRAGLMQKRAANEYRNQLELLEEISRAWNEDFENGGIESWKQVSKIDPKKSLFQEDLSNLQAIADELKKESKVIEGDTEFIKVEGNRISKIIHSMRRLGHVKAEASKHSLHAILNDCCHIMADLFDQKRFSILKEFSAANDLVLTDRDEMIQAVTNLMRNSLQALEAAGAKGGMTVRTHNMDGAILVDIEDSGVGVSPENQKHLFESSFTTKPVDQGTGLGLGISRRFVRAYGGDIEFVSSRPLEKTIFRIRMPLENRGVKGAVA
jgi:signal transduction histidine kinase